MSDEQWMREALALALSRSDLVITTGGLGPTQDDLSKEIAAELLGLPMEFDPESWDAIGRYFEKIGRVCPMNNRKQAMFAKGCTILPNACGTAPGCMIEKDGKIVVQLPGPPHEMADMFGRQVYGRLAKKTGGCIASRFIRIYGMGESQVAQTCARWIENAEGVTVAPYCAANRPNPDPYPTRPRVFRDFHNTWLRCAPSSQQTRRYATSDRPPCRNGKDQETGTDTL